MLKVPVPKGLVGRGRTFWQSVTSVYVFRPDELELLREACLTLVLVDRLEASVADAEPLIEGSTGQLRANPLLAEVRMQRLALASMLRQLKIPDAAADVPQSHRTRAASHAAKARWRSDSHGDVS